MTTLNDLWSLYAQTVVRFDYYACEKYYESHQITNFERDSMHKLAPLLYTEMLTE